jgi:hypothetical protein
MPTTLIGSALIRNKERQSDLIYYFPLWKVLGFIVAFTTLSELGKIDGRKVLLSKCHMF